MSTITDFHRQWEKEHGKEYKGKPVLIRGTQQTVHRFNPNVVAVSVIVVTQKSKPTNCYIKRLITSLHCSTDCKPFFKTNAETITVHKGKITDITYGNPVWAHHNELNLALINHERVFQNLQNAVKNADWHVTLAKHYTEGSTWDSEAARGYNFGYGLCTIWKFGELAIGDKFGIDRKGSSYTKISETQIQFGDKDSCISNLSPDFEVCR